MVLTADVALYGAPLWPAGHLPHLGGDWQLLRPRSFCNVDGWRNRRCHPISPQVGEMSGRTEGGATERNVGRLTRFSS
ncbi:MAG: hypothetical protein E5X53_06220 [Mesorhizobium sp.]|nr:MAG: hypothetical protein EOR73_12160 [Mesorhizobium sp.]TIP73779.1 MAG: hypothetical protein E5X55_12470 [Mesorhizobium sp.]TIQ12233.1 MAG: hypothetical protein E5X57_14250 [Mesorhizobium sp.]TIR53408.1 MAG: hypothetical protein E5X53_06220 [Mesorhizobium sp.]TJV99474.1 MAG: hypothetical protein E5X52_06175 [Mesorhizobium sp.]